MESAVPVQSTRMDAMYRYTRHVYDLSRKCYLLGRDRLIHEMEPTDGAQILEMGCGTARNLRKIHRRYPTCKLFGLDASSVMLETAEKSIDRAGAAAAVQLQQELAENLDYTRTFNCDRPFDVIFFSYSISMIPTWQEAIDAALRNLSHDGTIWIVDFWDQAGWSRWFRALLRKWLAMHSVYFRQEVLQYLEALQADGRITYEVNDISRRYAYLAKIKPTT